MSGTCDAGFVFYSCGNGFRGCCSEPACDLGGCPDDAAPPGDDPAPTSTTRRTHIGTSPTSLPTESAAASATSTADPTAGGSSGTAIETATPSLLPSPSTPTDPTSTSAASQSSSSSSEAGTHLSTAAIAGICVGGTVLVMFALLLVSLRIRRRRIAKRHASSAGVRYSDTAYAENFMKDHPSMVQGRVELG
ncbi:hypothetical protein F4820DRAFT_463800 [Hypoxylon rubiginosum]|uniref:Uncharacterized protein n=1 Tax=Hypoxylon rubiginosum TaxID=110542 RepID=A0ACB9ZC09_9PEZI|nr:hypothetical protein F4820DRAFT_463800 [Hypoxylon rubiginosum]